MHLLHTVLHLLITGSTVTMNQCLVVGILEIAGLRYRQTTVDEAGITIDHHDIRQIEVRRTGRTNTVFRTLDSHGIGSDRVDLTPIRGVTVYIHQSHLCYQFVVEVHTDGVLIPTFTLVIFGHINESLARNSHHVAIHIHHPRTLMKDRV